MNAVRKDDNEGQYMEAPYMRSLSLSLAKNQRRRTMRIYRKEGRTKAQGAFVLRYIYIYTYIILFYPFYTNVVAAYLFFYGS